SIGNAPQGGSRPVAILSRNVGNKAANATTTTALTIGSLIGGLDFSIERRIAQSQGGVQECGGGNRGTRQEWSGQRGLQWRGNRVGFIVPDGGVQRDHTARCEPRTCLSQLLIGCPP